MMLSILKKWNKNSSIVADVAHVHKWELAAKTFCEPKPVTSLNDSELTRLALTGKTTYLFTCACGEFKKEECEGMEESALDRLLDKVDVGGPEYIIRDGKTYVLLKKHDAQPPQSPPMIR